MEEHIKPTGPHFTAEHETKTKIKMATVLGGVNYLNLASFHHSSVESSSGLLSVCARLKRHKAKTLEREWGGGWKQKGMERKQEGWNIREG